MSTSGERTILAVDLGTQSLRVSAIGSNGARLWAWSAPVQSDVGNIHFEQSAMQWRELLDQALSEAARAGVKPDAIATAGPLAGYVALDEFGEPLTPAVMYTDGRSLPDVQRVEQALGDTAQYRPVVSDPWPQWLRLCRERPDVVKRTKYFLDATGWLNFHLTQVATLNSYTALRLPDESGIAKLGLSEDERPKFGRSVAIGETIGLLSDRASNHFNGAEIPVVAATFDSKCAYIGSGIEHPGDALDISGTVTSFGVISEKRINDPQRRIYTVPFSNLWLTRGSTAAAGSTLEWAKTQLLQTDFAAIDKAAEQIAPGANGLSFLPYLSGERTPLWNPNARGALLGLGLDTSQAAIARAVYEGVAFSLAHIVRTIEECGEQPKEIRLAGGLARNDLLAQIKADVLGIPLLRLSDHELTTLGLTIIASVGIGLYPDHATASKHLVQIDRTFTPNPDLADAYRNAEARYRAYSDALKPVFSST